MVGCLTGVSEKDFGSATSTAVQSFASPEHEGQVVEQRIDDRRGEQREQERERLAADDDDGDHPALLGTRAGADGQREHAGHEGERRHEDRPKPVAVSLEDRRGPVHPARPQVVHVVDLEDGVFLDHAEQDQDPERRIEVQRVAGEPERQQAQRGRQSGRESRMVKGWTRFSNWEARIMYMKTIERAKAQMNSPKVRSSSRPRPETRVV